MNVVWLTRYGPEGASTRYRATQFVEPLAAAGITSLVEPLAPWRGGVARQAAGVARRVRRLRSLPEMRADAVVVQKEPAMPPLLWPLTRPAVKAARVPVIWDIDDAVWIGRRGAASMAEDMARAVDVVVAGNALLARWATEAGAARVEMIPTCYRPPEPPDPTRAEDGRVHVVWIGSPASVKLLDASASTLRSLFAGTDVHLTAVGAAPSADFGGMTVDVVPWSPASEHAQLSIADYGLGLQPRTEYADHKCGFKLVQYLAYGVIPIATASPVHTDILGGVGHLIDGAESVAAARAALAHPPTAEDRQRARQRWESSFSSDVAASRWLELLRSVGRA